jgi:hypothetical protein
MPAGKIVLIALLVISCILVGCEKKPAPPLPVAAPSPAPAVKTAKTDSADIFNEFYTDSVAAVDKARNTKTFSLNPSKVKSPKTTTPANGPGSAYTPDFSDNGRYVVQVASMNSRWLADELATQFKEKGYPAYVIEVQNPRPDLSGAFYRVRIGAFSSSVDAKAFGDNILVPAHFVYWVDRKANESSAPLESQLNQGPAYSGTSTTPSTAPSASTPPPAHAIPPSSSYESTIIPGPGTVPATTGPATAPSSTEKSATGGWRDSSGKW